MAKSRGKTVPGFRSLSCPWTLTRFGSAQPGLRHCDVVDQPGRSELCRHQQTYRSVLDRLDRRQRLGVARLEIIEREPGAGDRVAALAQEGGDRPTPRDL